MHGITTLFALCVYEFVKYYPDTPSTKPHTSLTFPSSHMPNKRLALTPVMLRPMWGDNTKHFHAFEAFLIRMLCNIAAKAAEKVCPDLESFPLPLPPTHHPILPSCPDWPRILLRKAGEQAEEGVALILPLANPNERQGHFLKQPLRRTG